MATPHNWEFQKQLETLSSDLTGPSKTAFATIKGFEAMHALRKEQASLFQYGGGITGEVRLIERQFNLYTA